MFPGTRGNKFFFYHDTSRTTTPMKDQRRATYYGLAAVALWSTVATAFKLTLAHMDPVRLVLWSSLFSTLALAAALAARGELGRALDVRPVWKRAALGGLLNPAAYYLILFRAYDLLPAQEAQAINYTWAVTLSLLSVPFLGQRVTRADGLALLLSYAGVLVIATRGDIAGLSFESPLGVGLALFSTLLWAGSWIAGARDPRPPVAALFQNFVFGTAFALLAALVWSTSALPQLTALAGAAYIGLFEMGLTFVLWLSAVRLATSTARIGNLIFLSPLVSLALINLVLGEPILRSTLLGLALILGGQALQRVGDRE